MRLYSNCTSSRNTFRINPWARSRPNRQMKKANYLELNCRHCAGFQKTRLKDIHAEGHCLEPVIGWLIAIAAALALSFVNSRMGQKGIDEALFIRTKPFLFVSALIVSPPLNFWRQEIKNSPLFNSYLINRS